mgnify:FL=1
MEKTIHRMNNQFDFSKITISQPSAIQGGAYFTKIKYNGQPLFIQSGKCKTRQGVVETNKKSYIDLMYTHDDDETIEWFENLETRVQQLIYEKKDIWFQNDLDLTDIENAFTTTTRAFKGGRYHLVRINMTKHKTFSNQYTCTIYDDNENIVGPSDFKAENDVITIFEVQGIKFTSRNFQIELNSKQIMIINDERIFNECIIKKSDDTAQSVTIINHDTQKIPHSNEEVKVISNNSANESEKNDSQIMTSAVERVERVEEKENEVEHVEEKENEVEHVEESLKEQVEHVEEKESEVEHVEESLKEHVEETVDKLVNEIVEESIVKDQKEILYETMDTEYVEENKLLNSEKESFTQINSRENVIDTDVDIDTNTQYIHTDSVCQENIESLGVSTESTNVEENIVNNMRSTLDKNRNTQLESLEDITMNLDITNNSNMQLKTRNDVYYEIYKEAKNKANQAKKAAIKAYLDAKKIKNTYLMDEMEDDSDDSDNDSEILSEHMEEYSSDVDDLKKEITELANELM